MQAKAVKVRVPTSSWSSRHMNKELMGELNRSHGGTEVANAWQRLVSGGSFTKLQMAIVAAGNDCRLHTRPYDDDGWRVCPANHIDTLLGLIASRKQQFDTAFQECEANWEDIVMSQQSRLGDTFNVSKFPSWREVSHKFSIEFRMEPLPAELDENDLVMSHGAEIAKEIIESANRRKSDATRLAVGNLLRRLIDVLEKAHDKLSDPEAQFKVNILENVIETLQIVEDLNFDGIPVVAELAAKIRKSFEPVEMDAKGVSNILRNSSTIRDEFSSTISGHLREIREKMEGYF